MTSQPFRPPSAAPRAEGRDPSSIGSCPVQAARRLNLDRAAAQAYRCILHSGQTQLPIDPLAMLRLCRDTVVVTYAEAASLLGLTEAGFERLCGTADALTYRLSLSDGTICYIVCYRPGGNQARLRFTLAHELGHRVLGHAEDRAPDNAEANHFAAHLLCPRPVVRRLTAQFRPLYAEQIAQVCFTSVAASESMLRSRPCHVDHPLEDAVDALLAPSVLRAMAALPKPSPAWHPVTAALYFQS